jgi:hypothetical protein
MRKLIPQAILVLVCLCARTTFAHERIVTDTVKTVHKLDGNLSEWKPEGFTTDGETKIQYAADHDADNLYLALKVTDQGVQMKMMMQGMYLYVDKRGKKKEGTGIEFPVKRSRESGGGFGGGGGRGGRPAPTPDESGNGGRPDPAAMREKMATMLLFLKSFGFGDGEEKTQLITQPDAVNVAFDWDDNNLFIVEYLIPLKLLGTKEELNGKTLGIGWKINGMEAPAGPVATSTQLVAVPAGSSRPSGGGSGKNTSFTPRADFGSNNDSRFREQSFWTKHILNL